MATLYTVEFIENNATGFFLNSLYIFKLYPPPKKKLELKNKWLNEMNKNHLFVSGYRFHQNLLIFIPVNKKQ